MNVPQFNAEAALYRSARSYHGVVPAATRSSAARIEPQQIRCPPLGMCRLAIFRCPDPTWPTFWCRVFDQCANCWDAR